MTNQGNASPWASTASLDSDSGVLLASRFASEVRSRWRHGERPDAAAVLAEHPELKRYKSVLLDLALDEYSIRLEAGESLDADEFSRRFPNLQRSLFLLIEVQRLLDQDPHAAILRESIPWPEPGETFLGFSLIAELGRGAFGRVFLASEPALGDRPVALKVAPRGGEEAEILGKLRHPNIVPVYSVQQDAATGLTAVCMPYLGRATLCDVLDQAFAGPRPPTRSRVILDTVQDLSDDPGLLDPSSFDRILRKGSYVDGIIRLAVQLSDALAYTHSRGICHRDLKPSNVLLSPEGRPLLLDFNLSFDKRRSVSKIGGTLPYMAPEQLRFVLLERPDRKAHADPRSDLFSLGVILYELLSGAFPFGPIPCEPSIQQIAEGLLRQQEQGPQPVQAKNQHVDKGLAQLLDDCLAFDPESRPESAIALAAAFRKQLAPVRRGKRWVRNHRRRAVLTVSLVLALVLAGVGFAVLRDPYSTRQFKLGLEYSNQHEYELAVGCLSRSIRADPNHREALFARGVAHQKLGNFAWAFEDFEAASQLAPSPKITACKGYCLSRINHHDPAIECYRNALEMGYDPPALLNNMGYGYIQLEQLEAAEDCLNRAIEENDALQAAHHNLVLVSLNRGRGGQPIPGSALVQARKAAETCPPSADLYYHVGTLYALAAKQNSGLTGQAVVYLKKAVAHGLDPRELRSNPVFSALHERPDFSQLLSRPAPTGPPVKADFLVDPL